MGSDSVHKSSANQTRLRNIPFYLRVLLTILTLSILFYSLTHPNNNNTQTSNDRDPFPIHETKLAHSSVPPTCHTLLDSFLSTQRQAKINRQNHLPFSQTIVFACHRKWCNKLYGFCQPCRGIGDRTRHLLASVTEANRRGLSVEIDYPRVGRGGIDIRFRGALEYRDKWGWVSEWLRFRSYDVSGGELRLDRWGGTGTGTDTDTEEKKEDGTPHPLQDQFVHFIPTHGSSNGVDFDPCLYHVLFTPTPRLFNEIQYYSNIFRFDTHNVLGIHFRTGDVTAWNIHNKDVRAAGGSGLEEGYDRMIRCAAALADRLGVRPMVDVRTHGNHNNNDNDNDKKDGEKKLHFYLATDNQIVKDRARKETEYVVYLTDENPSAYLRAEGDNSAYLELYLLSRTRGLVINQLPEKYEGTGTRLSTFAVLAQKIGFMDDDRIMPCVLE